MVGWLVHWIFKDAAVCCRMRFGKNCVQWNVKDRRESYRSLFGRKAGTCEGVTAENMQEQAASCVIMAQLQRASAGVRLCALSVENSHRCVFNFPLIMLIRCRLFILFAVV